MFGNSKGFNNVPQKTFATKSSHAKDFNRIEMMRDRGIIYQPNGTGRDTYIYNDDGGFNKVKEPRTQFHPASFLPGLDHKKYFSKDKSPYIHSKPVQYPEDGSGRDFYIKDTMGGFGSSVRINNSNEYRQAFKKSLRTYDKIPFYLERRNYNNSVKQRKESIQSEAPNPQFESQLEFSQESPLKNQKNQKKAMLREIYGSTQQPEGPMLDSFNRTQMVGMGSQKMVSARDRDHILLSGHQSIHNDAKIVSNKTRNKSTMNTAVGSAFSPKASRFRDSSPKEFEAMNKIISKEKSVERILMMDNPNNSHLHEINKYIKALDSRLSIPKFDEERQSNELMRRSFNRENRNSNSSLPKNGGSPNRNGDSQSPGMVGRTSNKQLQSFLNQGIHQGSVMKLQNMSPSNMKSQDQRQMERKLKQFKGNLQKVTADDRDTLFSSIKKGKNHKGGIYGTYNNSPQQTLQLTQASSGGYDTSVQDPYTSGQKYQMCQKDPIIIRGSQNVAVNHMVIRDKKLQ